MEFKQQYAAYQQAIEEYLNGIFTADKPYGRLQEAMRYSILGGGKRIRPVLALEELPELAAADRTAEASELWEAVARLPEKLRTAVHLYYAEGCRAEEIARLTGVPAATVRTRLRRARIKLKDLLGGMDDEREQIPDLDGETLRA